MWGPDDIRLCYIWQRLDYQTLHMWSVVQGHNKTIVTYQTLEKNISQHIDHDQKTLTITKCNPSKKKYNRNLLGYNSNLKPNVMLETIL